MKISRRRLLVMAGASVAGRALAEAAAADAATRSGGELGPLHGVPMTIKDSFDTAGVVSTAGTLGRRDYVPERDATVVARLRAAGAILVVALARRLEAELGGYHPPVRPPDPSERWGARSRARGTSTRSRSPGPCRA